MEAKWLPELRGLTRRISDAFSANFALIGCVGQVQLIEQQGDDFAR